MAATYAVGCKELRIGSIGTAGIMGTLTSSDAVKVYKDTLMINDADPSFTPHKSENSKYPDVVVTDEDAPSFEFDTHDTSKATLARFLGGTADGSTEKWSAQVDHFSCEKSMEVDTIFDETWQYPRVMLVGSLKYAANRKEIAKIHVKGYILNPTGAATLPVNKIPNPA